jgi:exosortase A-associated hydrolase 1
MGAGMRRQLSFDCNGASCAATLDAAGAATGLLIVSGGNEIRSGAHRGMAWIAGEVAALGYPVFRYDRRGIGDSTGSNGGFRSSGPDIAAAVAAFRADANVERIIAFGNCDAAAALALFGGEAGIAAMLLANPWTFDAEEGDDTAGDDTTAAPALPPASAIRARYLARLKDPRQLWRLVSGGVDYRKLLGGLKAARGSGAAPTGLAAELIAAMAALPVPARILLAERDRTAMAFAEHWAKAPAALRSKVPIAKIASGSHGFADNAARAWLLECLVAALAEQSPA